MSRICNHTVQEQKKPEDGNYGLFFPELGSEI